MTVNMKRARYAPLLPAREADSLAALEAWMRRWPHPWVSISGGKDSLVALHLACRVNPDVPVAFFNSGIEFPQTLKYVHGLAKAWKFDLHVYHADPSPLELMEANGSWERGRVTVEGDLSLHEAAIERPLAQALADLGPACVYGVRADEAENRRMYLSRAKGQVEKKNRSGMVTRANISPAWRWSSEEVFAYISEHDLPLNPLYRQQIELGIPEHRARVGMIVDGWALEQGRWAVARALAPDESRRIEAALPALAEWR